MNSNQKMRRALLNKVHELKSRIIQPGDKVRYGGEVYEVAEMKKFAHGMMVGIYDEPPSKHIDYLNIGSVALVPNE